MEKIFLFALVLFFEEREEEIISVEFFVGDLDVNSLKKSKKYLKYFLPNIIGINSEFLNIIPFLIPDGICLIKFHQKNIKEKKNYLFQHGFEEKRLLKGKNFHI